MIQPFFLKLIYIGVVLLVSLIPAYLLYRTLPGDARAKGTLKGIRFKLGGAFAGYFVLVLTIFLLLPPEIESAQKAERNRYALWTLHADYRFSDDSGLGNLLKIETDRENPETDNGRLKYRLVGEKVNGEWKFPDIYVGHENYKNEDIFLDRLSRQRDSIRVNSEEKTIKVTKPIILKRKDQ